jgi:hypothetical protein
MDAPLIISLAEFINKYVTRFDDQQLDDDVRAGDGAIVIYSYETTLSIVLSVIS